MKPGYVCPFGVYCPHGHNKKYQPSGVCWWFFLGECKEESKKYETDPVYTKLGGRGLDE